MNPPHPKALTVPPPSTVLAWKKGILDFNSSQFWHAHENWEKGWTQLPAAQKEYVQGLIQAAAAFFLLKEKWRPRPALSLCRSALNKLEPFKNSRPELLPLPRIVIPDLEQVLSSVQSLDLAQISPHSIDWDQVSLRLRASLLEESINP